jgi:hypothetical protein
MYISLTQADEPPYTSGKSRSAVILVSLAAFRPVCSPI